MISMSGIQLEVLKSQHFGPKNTKFLILLHIMWQLSSIVILTLICIVFVKRLKIYITSLLNIIYTLMIIMSKIQQITITNKYQSSVYVFILEESVTILTSSLGLIATLSSIPRQGSNFQQVNSLNCVKLSKFQYPRQGSNFQQVNSLNCVKLSKFPFGEIN